MRLLDLFCGRWGWSRAFAARGWRCWGIDLTDNRDQMPEDCEFCCEDVFNIDVAFIRAFKFDFIVASSPCEEFACFGMPHFRPNPRHPFRGLKLFNHTRDLCESSGVPYVMENVRAAQQFVGNAAGHAGSFYLWGNAVPPLLPKVHKAKWRANVHHGRSAPGNFAAELNLPKQERKALLATIPPELANCVADYAERICDPLLVAGKGE